MSWTEKAKTRADVADTGQRQTIGFDEVKPKGYIYSQAYRYHPQINQDKSYDGSHNALGDSFPIQLHGNDLVGMYDFLKFIGNNPSQQVKTNTLDSSGGRPRTSTEIHEERNHQPK